MPAASTTLSGASGALRAGMISLSRGMTRIWVGYKSRWRSTSCAKLRASWWGGHQDLREVRLLNRIFRWAKEGL
eukprot:10605839-Alexandrium_andersonii.AAC.1